jgi:hypothetical protein
MSGMAFRRAPKASAVALSFCCLLGLGCQKQAFAKIATPRFCAKLKRTQGVKYCLYYSRNECTTITEIPQMTGRRVGMPFILSPPTLALRFRQNNGPTPSGDYQPSRSLSVAGSDAKLKRTQGVKYCLYYSRNECTTITEIWNIREYYRQNNGPTHSGDYQPSRSLSVAGSDCRLYDCRNDNPFNYYNIWDNLLAWKAKVSTLRSLGRRRHQRSR